VCYNRCYGNAVTGFCALWNNISDVGVKTVTMLPLFRDFIPYGIMQGVPRKTDPTH
jgi:hypothetical protein